MSVLSITRAINPQSNSRFGIIQTSLKEASFKYKNFKAILLNYLYVYTEHIKFNYFSER